jgi:UDP-N-acetylglucosamine acyltransferase
MAIEGGLFTNTFANVILDLRKTMAIHATAFIDAHTVIDPTCEIGPYVVIDGPVRIGPDCWLGPSVIVVGNTEIGAGCFVHSHAVIGDVPQDRKFKGSISLCVLVNWQRLVVWR